MDRNAAMASSSSASRFSSSSPRSWDPRLAARPRRNRMSVWSGWSVARGRRIARASANRLPWTSARAVLTRGSDDRWDGPNEGDAGAWTSEGACDGAFDDAGGGASGAAFDEPSGVTSDGVSGRAPDAEPDGSPDAATAGEAENRITRMSVERAVGMTRAKRRAASGCPSLV